MKISIYTKLEIICSEKIYTFELIIKSTPSIRLRYEIVFTREQNLNENKIKV